MLKVYSLKRREYEFQVDNGDETFDSYILRELTGALRDQYLTNLNNRMRTRGGSQTIQDFNGIQSDLLACCVYKITGDEPEGKLVSKQTLQSWPSSMLQDLFDQAQEISGLKSQEAEEKEAKND